MSEWIKTACKLPPENKVVETKIDDGKGCRNIQKLMRIKTYGSFLMAVCTFITLRHIGEKFDMKDVAISTLAR